MGTEMSLPEPTEEQYRLAWRHWRGNRGPLGCPETLEATRAHPVYGRCLRAAAQLMGRPQMQMHGGAAAQAASRLGTARDVPPTPEIVRPARQTTPLGHWPSAAETAAARPAFMHRQRLGANDAKKAAANDND